jgi:hypothetical protein
MTTERRHIRFLLAVCGVLALLYAASFALNRRTAPKTATLALLNEKYLADIAVIRAVPPETPLPGTAHPPEPTALEVRLADSLWTCISGALRAPAAPGFIDSLLKKAAAARKLYLVSEKPSAFDALSLADGNAFRLDFLSAYGDVRSSLYFGAPDFTGRLISVRSASLLRSYQTQNDFLPWLVGDLTHWSDESLVPKASGIRDDSDIQSVTLFRAAAPEQTASPPPAARLTDNAEAFHALASLRSVAVREAGTGEAREPVAALRVEGGNGSVVDISLFPVSETASGGAASGAYIAVPKIACGPAFSPADKAAASAFSYALEISSWTYSRIMELFE